MAGRFSLSWRTPIFFPFPSDTSAQALLFNPYNSRPTNMSLCKRGSPSGTPLYNSPMSNGGYQSSVPTSNASGVQSAVSAPMTGIGQSSTGIGQSSMNPSAPGSDLGGLAGSGSNALGGIGNSVLSALGGSPGSGHGSSMFNPGSQSSSLPGLLGTGSNILGGIGNLGQGLFGSIGNGIGAVGSSIGHLLDGTLGQHGDGFGQGDSGPTADSNWGPTGYNGGGGGGGAQSCCKQSPDEQE